jgi:threonine/homoserine/homoserine lactone efflux protein
MMSVTASLIAFTLAAGLLTITPGLDTALVLRTAAIEGPRRAVLTALGISSGLMVWALIAAFGLGALLAASELAYTILRWAGAAYLCWLGLGLLLRPRQDFAAADAAAEGLGGVRRSWYLRGLMCNLLNPKVGVFYVTFLPQFVPDGVNVTLFILALTAIHLAEGALWLGLIIAATRPLARFLRRPVLIRGLDRLTGAVLIGFGIKLAAEQRG